MQPGFAAGFANQQPQAERMYQDIIAGRQRLQQAARQQQAMEGWFKSLITPDAAAIPQQGPPGMQMQPQQQAPAGGAPGVPGMPGTPSGPAMPPGRAIGGPTMGGAPSTGAPPQASAGPAPPPRGA